MKPTGIETLDVRALLAARESKMSTCDVLTSHHTQIDAFLWLPHGTEAKLHAKEAYGRPPATSSNKHQQPMRSCS